MEKPLNEFNSLLHKLEAAHEKLLDAFPSTIHGKKLKAVREGFAEELKQIDPEDLHRSPAPGEWSVWEVMEHVIAHDMRHQEVETRGLDHYEDHGREHIGQLVDIRRTLKSHHNA